MVNRLVGLFQQGLFGRACTFCGADADIRVGVCGPCRADMARPTVGCAQCGIPLPQAGLCGRCQRRPPAFDRVHAAFIYASPLDTLIQGLKFNGRLDSARVLGELMADELAGGAAPLPDLLVPVPLHPQRLYERGYNQALELGRVLRARLRIPLEYRRVHRVRNTGMQTLLPARQRFANLQGAFAVNGTIDRARVVIVDDVMTTGATASELSATLRAAGAESIEVWVCARAVG